MKNKKRTKRIDITLPTQTLEEVDNAWQDFGYSSRSDFIKEAAKRLTIRLKKAELKNNLRVGYKRRAERDRKFNQQFECIDFDIY